MPVNRKKRTRGLRPTVPDSATVRRFLETGEEDPGFEIFALRCYEGKLLETWEALRGEILLAWIKKYPCTRPWAWWALDAPRWQDPFTDCFYHGTLPEPRRRLGGIGTPSYEVLAYGPRFEYGLPMDWITKWEEDYYNGRAKDIHGNPIGTEHKEGDFKGKAIDPEDPPRFESEAAYLERHGLLSPAELRYLEKHPELAEPAGCRSLKLRLVSAGRRCLDAAAKTEPGLRDVVLARREL